MRRLHEILSLLAFGGQGGCRGEQDEAALEYSEMRRRIEVE